MSIVKIVQERECNLCVEYALVYDRPDGSGGFSFPCNERGDVHVHEMHPAGLENLRKCQAGEYGELSRFVDKREYFDRTPRIGLCECGEEVYLDRFTCTCHGCGRDYNSAGQELASREQWGEETGESISDILSVDSNPDACFDD